MLVDLVDHDDVSGAAEAARGALNVGYGFEKVVLILREKGYRVSGDERCFSVTPLFDLVEGDEEQRAAALRILKGTLP